MTSSPRILSLLGCLLLAFGVIEYALLPSAPSARHPKAVALALRLPSATAILEDTGSLSMIEKIPVSAVLIAASSNKGTGRDYAVASGAEILRLFRMEGIVNVYMWEQIRDKPIRPEAAYFFTGNPLLFKTFRKDLSESLGSSAVRPYSDGNWNFGGDLPGNYILEIDAPVSAVRKILRTGGPLPERLLRDYGLEVFHPDFPPGGTSSYSFVISRGPGGKTVRSYRLFLSQDNSLVGRDAASWRKEDSVSVVVAEERDLPEVWKRIRNAGIRVLPIREIQQVAGAPVPRQTSSARWIYSWIVLLWCLVFSLAVSGFRGGARNGVALAALLFLIFFFQPEREREGLLLLTASFPPAALAMTYEKVRYAAALTLLPAVVSGLFLARGAGQPSYSFAAASALSLAFFFSTELPDKKDLRLLLPLLLFLFLDLIPLSPWWTLPLTFVSLGLFLGRVPRSLIRQIFLFSFPLAGLEMWTQSEKGAQLLAAGTLLAVLVPFVGKTERRRKEAV
ncbi:MAG: hypothetical protein D6679_08870 [Candidatus Hydrogenedentota bacterium]|nr:MAG: hypothetical protein D6679_08870 [Candidatus Hydrogenedentota bacterium]